MNDIIIYRRQRSFIILLMTIPTFVLNDNSPNHQIETLYKHEYGEVRFLCDLIDSAWWKRPILVATRNGDILSDFKKRMLLEKRDGSTVLIIQRLQSDDTGIYECETMGAIRQYNLTVAVRMKTIEINAKLLSPFDSLNSNHNTSEKISHINDVDHQQHYHPLFHYDSISKKLRIREKQTLRILCFIQRSLPTSALDIYLPIETKSDHRVERNTTLINQDKTYRTLLTTTFVVTKQYHQQRIYCEGNQKIHDNNYKLLSDGLEMDVSFAPTCHSTFVAYFYTGKNRPVNLTCQMNDANPQRLNFTWILPSGQIRVGNLINTTTSYITILPSLQDFGTIRCRAQNEFGGIGECDVNMVLGATPDPIESCRYTYINATLTVNCAAGFHQGDEDFFCYMYKKQGNGSYSEHARLKGNCAFILPDQKPELHHDFRVFTKNKYGDNYEKSFSITVGKPKDKTRVYRPLITFVIIGACLLALLLLCCCCLNKFFSRRRKNKTPRDTSLTFQNHISSNGKPSTGLVHIKENGNIYPVRPYRSKDLMTSNGGPTLRFAQPRSIYNENESTSTRHSTLKETDLDELLGSAVLTTPTVKSLTMRSNGRIPVSPLPPPLFAAFQQQPSPFILDEYHQQHLLPIASQRRSSFQAATKQNGIDLLHESFYLSDIKLKHHDQYDNTERDLREREHYRETRRREYSSYRDDMADTSRQNDDVFNPRHSLVVENQMLTDGNERYNVIENPTDDRNDTEFNRWNEMKESEEIDYGLNSYIDSNYTDKDHILMDDYNDRNTGGADLDMDRLTNYTDDRNDSFRNFDRNDEQTDWNDMRGEEDRYRENGIFV